MRSALYYPHTNVQSEHLLKTALLFWDNLYVIVPWPSYRPLYDSVTATEAFELIGKCHYPSDAEKRKAHESVTELLDRPLPLAFSFPSEEHNTETYDIYPQKLLPDTVSMLRRRRMSAAIGPRNMRASAATGLTLMNIIADCCAGNTLARVTDRGIAYASLAGLLVEKAQHGPEKRYRSRKITANTVTVVDLDPLPMTQLLAFRKREASTSEGSRIRTCATASWMDWTSKQKS